MFKISDKDKWLFALPTSPQARDFIQEFDMDFEVYEFEFALPLTSELKAILN